MREPRLEIICIGRSGKEKSHNTNTINQSTTKKNKRNEKKRDNHGKSSFNSEQQRPYDDDDASEEDVLDVTFCGGGLCAMRFL